MIMGCFSMGNALDGNYISSVENITNVKISNAVFDDLLGKKADENSPLQPNVPPTEWTKDTYFHAKFDGTIYCGNADFGVDNTTNVLVKRRKKGEFQWMPIFDIKATKAEDYEFLVHDRYAPQGELEYALVPIINGFESDYSIASINYNFDGLLLLEKDKTVWTIVDIVLSEEKNIPPGVCNTVSGKYPFVFYNSENNYYTGTISATFIEFENCDLPPRNKLHENYSNVMEFLNNGKAKVLKYDDGRMRLIAVTDPPKDVSDEHRDKRTITFGYTEIGNVFSNEDMKKYNFLDVDEQWWAK